MEDNKNTNEQIQISGYVTKFLFQNDNGWGIALFKSDKQEGAQVKIKGQVGYLQPRVNYELTGHFEENNKYGKSFEVESYKVGETSTKEQIIDYFASGLFPTIGKVTASKIAEHYKENAIEKILENPESLNEVVSLNEAQRTIILETLKQIEQDNRFTKEFFQNGLKIDFLNYLKELTSDQDMQELIIENILTTNFYDFANENHLGPFEEVDKVAIHFEKLDKESLLRLEWIAHFVVDDILNISGNTYTTLAETIKKIKAYTGIYDEALIIKSLMKAKDDKVLYLVDKKIYTKESWSDEVLISKFITDRIYMDDSLTREQLLDTQLLNYIEKIEEELSHELGINNFKYDKTQKEALLKFGKSNIFLLTGGPGTGKTTVIKGMYKLHEYINNISGIGQIAIAAPTGRAASRINEIDPNLRATTIHKLLEATEGGFFKITADRPLERDMVILDESSMITNTLFARFCEASANVNKIVLVGDKNQLPSVGYGELFSNLLDVEAIPSVNLNEIHRQKEGNGIISLAYKILNNEIKEENDFELNNVKTFFNDEDPLNTINNIFSEKINPESDITDFQVITPFYKGEIGIKKVNKQLQETYQLEILKKDIEKEKNHILVRRDFEYFEDDKIMYLVNDGDVGLSNGDVGIIEDIELHKSKLMDAKVMFNDELKTFKNDHFNYSTLAYACSVHKTQGSEYKDVIFAIEKGMHEWFMNKKIIYTAITRAKNDLTLVGDLNAFIKACNREAIPRKTTLVQKINELVNK